MKQVKKQKIGIFILVIIFINIIATNANIVYGATNSIYGQYEAATGTIDLDAAISDSTVLDAVGHLVYALAGFCEKHIGNLIASFTGSNVFPWADKVIFNTIPFLDVNFLNPSSGSLFEDTSGEPTIFGNIVRNIYYTIFVISVAFFGVVVGIMALKLAISSIASEKAKYKEAITNWLLALILIFCAHYLMSFIFWVNEKMVEVASTIFMTQVEENADKINLDFTSGIGNMDPKSLTETFLAAYFYGATKEAGEDQADLFTQYNEADYKQSKYLAQSRLYLAAKGFKDGSEPCYRFFADLDYSLGNLDSDGKPKAYIKLTGTGSNVYDGRRYVFNWYGTGGDLKNWNDEIVKQIGGNGTDVRLGSTIYVSQSKAIEVFGKYLKALLTNKEYLEEVRPECVSLMEKTGAHIFKDLFDSGSNNALRSFRGIINDALLLSSLNLKEFDESFVYWEDSKKLEIITEYFNDMSADDNGNVIDATNPVLLFEIYKSANPEIYGEDANMTNEEKSQAIISNLADFFKECVYITGIDSENFKASKEFITSEFQPIVAILYGIFVVQSIMYFIAYIKRFFYITILALFAPIVVVYDFLIKTSNG